MVVYQRPERYVPPAAQVPGGVTIILGLVLLLGPPLGFLEMPEGLTDTVVTGLMGIVMTGVGGRILRIR